MWNLLIKYGNYSLLKLTIYAVSGRISRRSVYVVKINTCSMACGRL